jgi:glycosyltransferase involved in cell wall biosynthesis
VNRKVLIIVENLPVPFDTRVWKEALALRAAGYQVTVLSPKGKGHNRTFELLDGINIYRHPMPREGNSPLGYLWEYGCAFFWEFLFAWWIYLRRGFHVIQGCNPPDNIVLVALPFKLLGVGYIFDHHDVIPELYLSKYERKDMLYKAQVWFEKFTFRFSDVVISTNDSYRQVAIERGKQDPENVFVVRNGPDLRTFGPVPPEEPLKYGKRYLVGYVGIMSSQEGLDILLDVAERIRNLGRQDVHFTCVGSGPGLAELKKIAQEKHLGDMFNFTGRVSNADLLRVLSAADVCVNPDRPCPMNDMSTMIKIMEYMALGKPIVQFDLKEGRFSAQQASLYCSHDRQVEDFADKILWLLDHPEERKRMGEFGRRRVVEELAWEYSVGNLLAAYDKAFNRSHAKRSLQTDVARP